MDKRVTYDIDEELVEELKRVKNITKIPIKHHIERALREYLSRNHCLEETTSNYNKIQVKPSKTIEKPSKNILLDKINQIKGE